MFDLLRKIACLIAFVFAGVSASSQVATGLYNYGTFDNFGFDSINVGNLNLHFEIPVVNKPGRGGLDFNYNLVYDGSIWTPTTTNGVTSWVPDSSWGLRGQLGEGFSGYLSFTSVQTKCFDGGGGWYWAQKNNNYVYHDPFGVNHYFRYSYNSCSDVTVGDGGVSDNSGYRLAGVEIQTRDGRRITPPIRAASTTTSAATITDLNGNQIKNSGSGVFIDTAGVAALSISGGSDSSNPKVFTYKTTTDKASVQISYKSYTVQTSFGCSGIAEYGPVSMNLPDKITLGDGSSSYQLGYEVTPGNGGSVTGRLASIMLPTGGTISYSYSGGSNGIVCSDGSSAGLKRAINSSDSSAAGSWSYTRSSVTTGTTHTDVVDGLQNSKSYDFVIATTADSSSLHEVLESGRNIYQGAASGTPLLSRVTCYNGQAASCSTAAVNLPISQIDTYETLNGAQTRGATAKYDSYGNQTDQYDYDFGSKTRGALLRHEVWNYGGSIIGLPTLDAVYDGGNSLTAYTSYEYDTASLTASSNVPNHIAVSGARGNLTGIYRSVDGNTKLSTTNSYEDTGSILTSVSNGTTTYSYDPTYTYNTGVKSPTPSSGIEISSTSGYDSASTGLKTSQTDENGSATGFVYSDPLLRMTEVNYPDGGKTTYSYTPNEITVHQYIDGSGYNDSHLLLDGYGRKSRIEISSGQADNPWYQQEVCYDAVGNVSFQSYQYEGSGVENPKSCGRSGDKYSYDAIGRVLSIVRGDGSTISYSYFGRATKVTDENSKVRISQVDGLGRQTQLCEVTSDTSIPGSGSPSSCGLDIEDTGFVTAYSYDLANHKTIVTQGDQTRVFQTDWLGRLIYTKEPESGETTYGYVYNSTGLQVTRKKPRANQTDPSVLTTTISQYDSLNRIISVSYDDGTPTKAYTYDSTAPSWANLSQSYLKGRLSAASVAGAGSAFNYDANGRLIDIDQCLPSGCGNVSYNHRVHYGYDLAGNIISSTDGAGVVSTYTYSKASELLSLVSSQSDNQHPGTLVSNIVNSPTGPVSYSLGNGLSVGNKYDALGRLIGGWVRKSGSPPYCSVSNFGYRYSASWRGNLLLSSSDSIIGQGATYGYDDLSRLTSLNSTSGKLANFTYLYDRYGNRRQQNAMQEGPSPQLNFDTTSNRIIGDGYMYDAAGNMSYDGYHRYTYDAEGNVISVDGGATAQYAYDALNHRVKAFAMGYAREYIFDLNGKRVSIWDGSDRHLISGQYYWGSKPVAFYANAQTHFQHQDWLGTERLRTTYDGKVEARFASLAYGDAQTITVGADYDPYHYAQLDHDLETNTDHAKFRQYSNVQGRWMSPDPYGSSYDFSNPQSLNRYSYAENTPNSFNDPLGLVVQRHPDPCDWVCHIIIEMISESEPPYRSGGGRGSGGGGGGGNNSPQKAPNNGRNCSAGPASAGQYVAATAEVTTLTSQWASGLGPGDRTFGPDTATSAVMGQSAGVQDALNEYYMTGATQDLYSFGATGYVNAGANPVAQFVGSFRWSISGNMLTLRNATSFKSLTYDKGPQWQRSSFRPGGNTHQIYQIRINCH